MADLIDVYKEMNLIDSKTVMEKFVGHGVMDLIGEQFDLEAPWKNHMPAISVSLKGILTPRHFHDLQNELEVVKYFVRILENFLEWAGLCVSGCGAKVDMRGLDF